MVKLVAFIPVLLLAAGCGRNPSEQLARMSEEFVTNALTFSPSAATAAGLHVSDKTNLDDLLDDMGPATLDGQRRFYQGFLKRLNKLNTEKLTTEDRADLLILKDQCQLQILDLREVQSHAHNPALYVETVGNALFTPFVLEYAPLPERIRHIIARLQKVPLLLDQGMINLTTSPLVWTHLAMDENQGNIDLVDKTIRDGVPADLRDAYARAAQPALSAMRKFQDFLANNLTARDGSWRLGGDVYPRKFRLTMQGGMESDNVLEAASRDLTKVRARMLQLALPLHRQMAPGHKDHDDLAGEPRENQVIGEVLSHIADDHSTRDSYLDDARKDLEEARSFVQQKHLLTLPAHSNLQVIPTPDFMRGVYTAGGFNPAPVLEPKLGAFYWVTPIPPEWSKEKAESKLREYNRYMLQLLTLHEAMPGHYVQFESAAGVQPSSRRVLRLLYGNGAYIEGWAQYAEQAMLEEGYMNHSPELELTLAKQQLRVIANAILDIRLQMLNMTDREALDLMEKQAFQEHQEAVEKLQRAKATSAQLPTYYVGWNGWLKVREEYRQAQGGGFNLADFHDRALKEGAVPLPALENLLRAGKQP
jgi:uncharacterized protein (DUF885 family)